MTQSTDEGSISDYEFYFAFETPFITYFQAPPGNSSIRWCLDFFLLYLNMLNDGRSYIFITGTS